MTSDTPPKKQNNPRQQHWVPRVYLKHFATADTLATRDPKVWVWDKTTGLARRGASRVDTICSRKFLYTPKLIDGSRDWSMEDDMGITETRAGDVWPILASSDSALTDPAIRSFLAHFVALMQLRNVAVFDKFHHAATLVRQLQGVPDSDPRGGLLDVTDVENFAKGAFVRTIRSAMDRMASGFLEKRWAILRFPERTLATCDRPVLFHCKGRLVSGPTGKGIIVFFPVTADRLLYMDDATDQPNNAVCNGPLGVPALVNTLLHASALRIVVGPRPPSEWPTLDSIVNDGESETAGNSAP